ncbi:MAG TPA: glycosyltransferase family 2 protein [Smithella sp.]|jgi:glycosyltransferase involved in cell wall biosynthesis|nr:glycosyltransferase family 2 protein [Smithella sp.]HOR33156.1 glycosyltransferase family 2 protein [Syntrophales bacterium]
MDLATHNLPTVSIGIPTYNRPEGLSRTLAFITGQSYSNLEIIVSDNASPGNGIEKVVRRYMASDPRIQYRRQSENIGVSANFKFVLEQAAGEYFMWAADDDEWAPNFVEVCANLLKEGAVSAMTGFDTLYRVSGRRLPNRLPALDPEATCARNFYRFLRQPTPSLFYGLHRRAAVRFFAEETRWFDYYDCYFVLKLITQGPVVIWPEPLYTAGIDAPYYQIKPADRVHGLSIRPFLRAANGLLSSDCFTVAERCGLKLMLLYFGLRGYLWYVARRTRESISTNRNHLKEKRYAN